VFAALANAEAPSADTYAPGGRERRDLVIRADQHELGVEWFCQRAPGDLRADTPWITERHRQPDCHGVRTSM
jgi:hypothetical protein